MSIEFHVYCHDQRLAPVSDVVDLLHVAGGWQIRFVAATDTLQPAPNGQFIASSTALGWLAESRSAKSVDAAVASRDKDAVNKLFAKNHVAAVAIDRDDNFAPDPEDLVSLKQAGTAAEHIETVAKARCVYTLRTSASRNKLSLDLQQALWQAIGVAAYGLAHDPQNVTFDDHADILDEDAS